MKLVNKVCMFWNLCWFLVYLDYVLCLVIVFIVILYFYLLFEKVCEGGRELVIFMDYGMEM